MDEHLKLKINYAIFIIEELRDFKRTIPIYKK